MLNHLLRLLEQAPKPEIQPALLDDPDLQGIYHNLHALGALKRSRRADEILCPSCFDYRVPTHQTHQGEVARCPDCGAVPLPPGYTDLLTVHTAWLIEQLGTNFQVTSTSRLEVLEPDLLWRAGRLIRHGKPVDILLARITAGHDDEDRIARRLVDQPPEALQLVFLSRSSPLRRLEQPGRRLLAAIEDHAYLDASGLHIDPQPLLERLAIPPTKPSPKVEWAPDGAWLRVNGRELKLPQSKQRDFLLIVGEARTKGNLRPKLEWVLRQAGYAEGTSELKHITKRPEFFEFFGYGNGEVWINEDL